MLESEAKEKWCPRYSRENRTDSDYRFSRKPQCLGSDCACWIDDGYNDKAGERVGHCGLAR